MTPEISRLEQDRVALQAALDARKSPAERNRRGQFATPASLAGDTLRYAARLSQPGEPLRFLDPALGTGSFYAALRAVVPQRRIAMALGFEVDPHYGRPARRLWRGAGLVLRLQDFTRAEPQARFNLVVCNPPYVRHHHLSTDDKCRLRSRTHQASGMRLSGLAGLYCHFLGLAHPWMADGGIGGWLIPSEFMDVNYGQAVKRYLLERVTLLHIHRFDPSDVQFSDARVSSAMVWFRNAPRPKHHTVRLTFGSSLLAPRLEREVPVQALAPQAKWTRLPTGRPREAGGVPALAAFFRIRRGLATGDNDYFILPEERIAELALPSEAFTPILPSARYLSCDEVRPRSDGSPEIERRRFLLDIRLGEEEIRCRYPRLAAYLAAGRARGVHERYLCKHRAPWYRQERRPAAPIVCTYLGRADSPRGHAFRFILNGSRATVGNVYLAMYPTECLAAALAREPSLIRRIWTLLRSIDSDRLLEHGRVYGGGLYKLEPRELSNVRVPEIGSLLRPPQA